MKRYIVILLLLPCVAFGQFSKFGASRDTLGNYLLKSWKKDTLIVSLDTTRLRKNIADSLDKAFSDTTTRRLALQILPHTGFPNEYVLKKRNGIWQPLPDSTGGRNVFLFDQGYPQAIRIDSNATRTNYNLYYITQDRARSSGALSSFSNLASDSNRFSFDNNTSWILPPGEMIHQIEIVSSKVGSTGQTQTVVFEHPLIGTADSSVIAVKVVSRGGAYYLTFSKFYIPGLANPFSTTNTGGTNFLEVQLSSALFPSTGTVVSLKVVILTVRKRY